MQTHWIFKTKPRVAALCAVVAVAALASCGPVSPELAAEQCTDRARSAKGPTGKVAIGGGNQGISSSLEVSITSDFIMGRDPQQVYETCVYNKTGQGPIKPLAL
jgi:hypothetical protein